MSIPNNEVVVVINEACNLLECAFRNGVSEDLFTRFTTFYNLPGYFVDYGVNTRRGGLDKSIVEIRYNKAKHPHAAAQMLEDFLHQSHFRFILWKRPIIGSCLKSNILDEVFGVKTKPSPRIENSSHQYEVHFKHETIAKKVASYFTNISIQSNYDQKGWIHFVIKSNLLSEDVLLRILHDNNLPTNCYHYQEPNLASQSRELKEAIDKSKLLVELPTNKKERVKFFKASFQSKKVAEQVASFFTDTVLREESSYFSVIHPLLSEETVLRILRLEDLSIDNFAVKEIEI
jgi:hypothetical protein